jgi:hypothetical protein
MYKDKEVNNYVYNIFFNKLIFENKLNSESFTDKITI